ncbi:MAG: hypothetical protein ABIG31_02180 [Candidatus Omnitrophota bacterium]
MEKYAKFIVIGLIGFLLLSVVLNLQTYNTKQGLQREKDRLFKENQQLAQKSDEDSQRARRLEDAMRRLKDDLNRLNREKEDFQNRFNLLSQEKEELIEELKSQELRIGAGQPERVPLAVVPSGMSATEDSYWAGILKTKIDLEMQLGNLRSNLKTAQLNSEQLQREKTALQLDLNTFKREKEDLQRQVEYNKKLLDSIAQELVRERNDKLKIQESITTLKKENDVLTRQLKSISNRRYALEKKVQELQDDKAAIERRFTELENKLTERVAMVNDLKVGLEELQGSGTRKERDGTSQKESVELPPIVVRPASGVPEVRIQEGTTVVGGKILAINKDSNFVIIDLGEEASVKIGDTFKVYRLDKTIANLDVIQTRKNISACDIKSEIVPLQIGDTVR